MDLEVDVEKQCQRCGDDGPFANRLGQAARRRGDREQEVWSRFQKRPCGLNENEIKKV